MRELKKTILILTAGLLLAAAPALAQVQIGSETNLSASGTVSAGYSGSYGDGLGSSHGFAFGGTGNVNGSYFSPSFLSFTLTPYFNQSRQNSSFQSITNSTGLNATAAIFSGSKFPGWISYSNTYNSQGNYAVPGLTDYTTHGNGDTFGIGWGENLPNLPSLNIGFQRGASHASVYGSNADSQSAFRTFHLNSTYDLLGFRLNGGYQHTHTDTTLPLIFTNEVPEKSNSGSNNYSFGVSHTLPLSGSAWVNTSRTTSDYGSENVKGSNDYNLVTSGISLTPTKKWNVQVTSDYTDNLIGELNQTILASGGVYQELAPATKSNSLMVEGTTSYEVNRSLQFSGGGSHRTQTFFGETYGENTYSGTGAFSHMMLGGPLTISGGVFRTTLDYMDQPTIGVMSSVGYSHRLQAWELSGSFQVSQNQQQLLVTYTSTSYVYTGTVGRRLSKTYLTLSANGSKSTLSSLAGTSTYGQGYTATLSGRWMSMSGSYSRSSGNAIQTGAGLTPVTGGGTIYPIVTPTSLILYGGTSYSFGASTTPKRGLTANANYTHSKSNTLSSTLASNNNTDMLNVFLQYQVRKIYLTGGYSSLTQDFTIANTNTNHIKSYYIGISRWFNFF